MKTVTRKELVDNVLRPALEENEDFEMALKEIITRLHVMYPEVAKGFMDAVKETHRKNK
jgi:hypothetical protein